MGKTIYKVYSDAQPTPSDRMVDDDQGLSSTRRDLSSSWSFRHGRFQDHVNPTQFRLCWLLILLIFLVDGGFLLGTGILYHWLLFTPDIVVTVEGTLNLLPVSKLKTLLWIFPLLAVGYLYSALEILVRSVHQRRLTLTAGVGRVIMGPQDTSPNTRGPAANLLVTMSANLSQFLKKWVFEFLALDGRSFEVWFTIQELLQIISQTYQCYLLSWFVSTNWINQLAVALTFLNCCSTPVIRLLIPQHLPRQRLLCVLCDCSIGFVQSVVIPLIMFYPYYRDYDPRIAFFSDKLLYSDTWYNETVHQLDLLFIVSYFDFFTTVFPHVNFLVSLRGACRLVLPLDVQQTASPILIDIKPATAELPGASSCNLASSNADQLHTIQTKSRQEHPGTRRKVVWGSRLYALFSILYGMGLIVCHVVASYHTAVGSDHCKLHQNAWFVTKIACSVIHINCYASQLQGNMSEMETILQEFEPPSVSYIIVSHCPGLEMPPVLRSFGNLGGVDIFNSTLVSWSDDAAFDAHYHRKLHYLTMEYVRLTSFPEGIVGPNLPVTFSDVELYHTNLSSLPQDLGIRWSNLWSFYLEFCELKELPASLTRVSMSYFSVVGNEIESLPQRFLAEQDLILCDLSNNPLKTMEQEHGILSGLYKFSFEYTQLDKVPEWVMKFVVSRTEQGGYLEHSAFGTPFCRNGLVPWSSITNRTLEEQYRQIACAKDLKTARGVFPIDLIAPQRPLRAFQMLHKDDQG